MLRLASGAVWSWREESNLQPAVYKTAALPIELRQPVEYLYGVVLLPAHFFAVKYCGPVLLAIGSPTIVFRTSFLAYRSALSRLRVIFHSAEQVGSVMGTRFPAVRRSPHCGLSPKSVILTRGFPRALKRISKASFYPGHCGYHVGLVPRVIPYQEGGIHAEGSGN